MSVWPALKITVKLWKGYFSYTSNVTVAVSMTGSATFTSDQLHAYSLHPRVSIKVRVRSRVRVSIIGVSQNWRSKKLKSNIMSITLIVIYIYWSLQRLPTQLQILLSTQSWTILTLLYSVSNQHKWVPWCSGRVLDSWPTGHRFNSRPLHALQATLSKLLTYCVPPTVSSAGWEMSSNLPGVGMGWRPSVADWGSGMSASCTAGPVVH